MAQRHTPQTDQQIKEQVEHKLSEMDLSPTDIRVSVQRGIVTLDGSVPSAWAMSEAIEEATEVDDVQSVVNQLTVRRGESDQRIAEAIARVIRNYVFYSIYDDVTVRVNNGVATLAGRVTMPYKAAEMAQLASRVSGVRDVRNEIETLPVSTFDDQLRYAIASQLYRDPTFWRYAIQPNPPIHVIVENGRVTLTGVVDSEAEKRQAGIIARSTFGTLSVDNELRVEGRSQSQ
jgi:osmotically-inducible protein OsmY